MLHKQHLYFPAIHGVNFWRQRGVGKHFLEFVQTFGKTLTYLDLGWTGLHQYPSNLHWAPKKFWSLLHGKLKGRI